MSLFDSKNFSGLLQTQYLGRTFHYFEEIDSTNTRLKALAAEGSAEGSLIFADRQSQGRGRWGRSWESAREKNLLFSFLVRPQAGTLSQLTPLFGLACQQAVGMGRLKWPNDLWIGAKKIGGMLLEGGPGAIVVGLGLNVNQRAEEFPDELRSSASSLKIEAGRDWERELLLARILESCESYYELWKKQGFGPIRKQWNENAMFIGENVRAGDLQGTALGLDEDGGFLVRTAKGIETLVSGEVFGLRPVLD